jgi:glycine oxidase
MIGLSIAYELAKRGRSVALLEQDQFGRKASWAGAGILAPANAATAIHPQEQLEALSHELHQQWATELLQLTGIDNGFRKCGGLYLARTSGEVATLSGMAFEWKSREIVCEAIDGGELHQRFPSFISSQRSGFKPRSKIQRAIWVPGEAQIANPLHLNALVAACQKLGVIMEQEVGATRVMQTGGTLGGITASGKTYVARNYFFAAGPWTEQLVEPLGVRLPMQPVRGQIAMYRIPPECNSTADWPIVN